MTLNPPLQGEGRRAQRGGWESFSSRENFFPILFASQIASPLQGEAMR
jgi:hypothetical protein